MSILDQLYPGSFRGIPFLISSSDIKGGRKTVIHEFPNSDRRFVEDLGLLNETISLKVCVRSDYYFSNRDAIKDALEQPGYGTLVHPFYGIRNVAVANYTLAENTTELGDVSISLDLVVGQELLYPGAQDSDQTISQRIDEMFSSMKTAFYSSYSWLSSYGASITPIINAVRDFYELVDTTSNTYITRQNFSSLPASDYRAAYSDYVENSVKYIQADKDVVDDNLYDKTINLATFLEDVTVNASQGYSIGSKLAQFSLSKPIPVAITNQGRIRNKNLNSLVDMFLIAAFGITCRNAAAYDFKSSEDIDEIRSEVDRQYEVLLDRVDYSLSPDVMQYVQDIRSTLNRLLDSLKVTTPSIQVIEGRGLPLTVLEYLYYGDLPIYGVDTETLEIQSRTENLRLLNKDTNRNPVFNTGDVKLYLED